MKILVTGANGYIGTGVVEELLKLNQHVIATDFHGDNLNNIVFKECNIFEIDNPYEYFDKPDVVLHLAWRNGFIHDSESHLIDLPHHYSFLKRMSESGVKKIVVMGTMHEIGFYEGCINENTPCNPMSLYGISKNALRQAVDTICKHNNTFFQWIRGFYIVGNSDKGASIFSKISNAEKEGKKNFPFTDGKNQYDFLDYKEFCFQIANVAINNETFGIINCCSGEPQSLSNRVELFIQEKKYSIKLDYGVYPAREYDSKALWGDNSKICKILNQNTEKSIC